jgi:hypothetical protein
MNNMMEKPESKTKNIGRKFPRITIAIKINTEHNINSTLGLIRAR